MHSAASSLVLLAWHNSIYLVEHIFERKAFERKAPIATTLCKKGSGHIFKCGLIFGDYETCNIFASKATKKWSACNRKQCWMANVNGWRPSLWHADTSPEGVVYGRREGHQNRCHSENLDHLSDAWSIDHTQDAPNVYAAVYLSGRLHSLLIRRARQVLNSKTHMWTLCNSNWVTSGWEAPCPWIIAESNGWILAAHCTCLAGLGETYTYVASLLCYSCRDRQKGLTNSYPKKCLWSCFPQ